MRAALRAASGGASASRSAGPPAPINATHARVAATRAALMASTFAMIGVVRKDRGCAVKLFGEHRTGEQVRPGSRAEGKRSEEHTSELQSLMRISYAVFCLKKKKV